MHEESGWANVPALHAILEAIRPEVIFLEVPVGTLDEELQAVTRRNLESRAVEMYQERHDAKLVSVDLPTPKAEFFGDHEYLLKQVEDRSSQFRRLIDSYVSLKQKHGFYYLNSEHCSTHLSEVDEETLATLDQIDDSKLDRIYKDWLEVVAQRDVEMIKNIYQYCADSEFSTGVFLVGAAHRRSIIDQSKEQASAWPFEVEWNYDGKGTWYPQLNA